MVEEYKVIEGFENYAVSNTGKVKRVKPGRRAKIDTELCQVMNNAGYMMVTLYNKKAYCKTVHKLVAEAFLDKPKDYDLIRYDVDHIDNNKMNNNVENLQYLTHKENLAKSNKILNFVGKNKKRPQWHIERMKEGWRKRREANNKEPKVILKKYYELNYKGEIQEFNKLKEIQEYFNYNISIGYISYIKSGKCKNKDITITKKYKCIEIK